MSHKLKQKNSKSELYQIYVRTSAVGLEIVLSIVVGLGLGWWLDKHLKMEWLWLGGLLIGAMAAGRRLYLFTKHYLQKE